MHNLIMKVFKINYYPRDIDSGNFFENFLIASISTVIIIRLLLFLTDYPMISWSNYHIGHVLFGGVIMALAIFILLIFVNKEAKTFASILGGIGFGTFIDEIGKFITKDANYWYRPSIALIYVTFILLFLLTRFVEKHFKYRKEEYAINALDALKEAVLHDLDSNEKKKSLSLLTKAKDDEVTKILKETVKKFDDIKPVEVSFITKIKRGVKKIYFKFRDKPIFINSIIFVFAIISIYNLLIAASHLFNINSFLDFALTVFPLTSSLIVIYGIYLLLFKGKSRKVVFVYFKYALLISIFLTQYFRFVYSQLSAVSNLLLDLIILNIIQYSIREESANDRLSEKH